MYRSGATVYCPGIRPDRRAFTRSDRRQSPRPCPFTWGRAGEGDEVWVRVRTSELSRRPEGRRGQIAQCPECSMTIQIRHIAATNEAA